MPRRAPPAAPPRAPCPTTGPPWWWARPARPAPPSSRCSRPRPWPRARPPPTTGSAAPAPGCWPCRRTTSPACRCCCAASQPAPSPASSTWRDGFTADAFVARGQRPQFRPGDRRYTALVPTQLVRLLDDDRATAALARVRRGPRRRRGQSARPAGPGPRRRGHGRDDLRHERDLRRLRLRRRPLVRQRGPRRRRRPDPARRRRPSPPATSAAPTSPPPRSAPTTTGAVVPHRRRRPPGRDGGRWHVDGRLDDLITTGGLKVAPRLVEEALTSPARHRRGGRRRHARRRLGPGRQRRRGRIRTAPRPGTRPAPRHPR